MSRNEIEQIVTNLNLSNPFVVTKSMEIERIMRLKVPQGSLKKGEVCRSVIAIDIACRILQITVLKDSLISQAAVGKKLYNDSYNTCKRLLKIEIPTNITLDSLSIKYGNERITKYAKSLMHTYRKTIPENKTQNDLLTAAIFYTTAKHHQINLKLHKFLDDNDISTTNDFDILVKDIEARINDHLAHFNYEEEMDISLTSDFSMTQRPPTQLRSSSSAVTVPFPSGSSVESTINQEISISTKYRSTNSKRVAEFVTTKFATNSTEIDETISRKRQFTEKIFKMWMYEVREDVLASKRNT